MNTNINYIYIAYVVLWPLISTLFLHIDAAGRMYMILAATAIVFNINKPPFISTIKKAPIATWLCWCIYVAVVWVLIGKNSTDLNNTQFVFLKIFLPLISMIVSCYETYKNPRKFIRFLLLLYITYSIIGALFEQGSNVSWERGGAILGNSLPLTTVCLCFIASVCELKGWIKRYLLFICFAIAMICILTTATRKAFLALFIIVFFWYICKNKNLSIGNILKLLGFSIVIYYVAITVLSNTLLGGRILDAATNENKYNTTDNVFLELLDDRAIFYIEGWFLFLKKPIFGIGLRNFMIDFHYEHPIHSEYMVQITETGIIGTALYISFYLFIIKLILKTRHNKSNSNIFLMMLGFIGSILFISLTTWTYEFSRYYVVFGLIVGYSSYLIQNKNEINTRNK